MHDAKWIERIGSQWLFCTSRVDGNGKVQYHKLKTDITYELHLFYKYTLFGCISLELDVLNTENGGFMCTSHFYY